MTSQARLVTCFVTCLLVLAVTHSAEAQTSTGTCRVTWTLYTNMYISGGTQLLFVNSTADCMNGCIANSACVAVELNDNVSPPTCYLFKNITSLSMSTQLQNYEQYQLVQRCPQSSPPAALVCTDVWTLYSGLMEPNGVLQTGSSAPTTINACLASCVANISCIAADVQVVGTFQCILHFTAADLNGPTNYNASFGEYILTSRCGGPPSVSVAPGGSTTTFASSTGAVVTSTVAGPTGIYTGTIPSCVTFTTIVNQNSVGATQYGPSSISLATCQAYCASLPNCAAVDYDQSGTIFNGCWIHTNPSDLGQTYIAPSVTQYRIVLSGCSSTSAGGSTTIPSTPPACAQWSSIAQALSTGAQPYSQYTTIPTCEALCFSIPSCVAVDLDTSGTSSNGCWVHTNPNDLNLLYGSSSVTQYRINRNGCTTTVAGPSAASSAVSLNTLPVNTGTAQSTVCPPSWTSFANKNSGNGAPYPQFTSVATCEAACVSVPACVAIDFNASPGSGAACWLHLNASDLINVYDAVNVTQYRLLRTCLVSTLPVCISWLTYNNQQSTGGLPYPQYNTIALCQNFCSTIPTCVAVDFDYSMTSSSGCWVHTNPNDLTSSNTYLSPLILITQYILSNICITTTTVSTVSTTTPSTTTTQPTTTPGCTVTWVLYPNMNVQGGTPTRDLTVSACMARCVSYLPQCVGIDLNPTGVYCWLNLVNNPIVPYVNVTHYSLIPGSLCPTATSTTPPTTTPATTVTTAATQSCFFRQMTDANADGGDLIGKMTSLQCETICFEQYPYCVAVDYNFDTTECFMQTELGGREWNDCCERYEIACSTNGCTDTFVNFTSKVPSSLATAINVTTALNVSQCQAACLKYINCTSVVWGVAARFLPGQNCILMIGPTGIVGYSADYNLYPRQFCQNNLFTTAAPTVPPTPPPGYCIVDLVFVIDTSGSIGEDNPIGVNDQLLQQEFIGNITRNIQIGTYFDHVALVVFQTTATIIYTFAQPQDFNSFEIDAINAIPSPAGETNLPAALDLAYELLYQGLGGRPDAFHVVVLVTDGETTLAFRPNLAASINQLISANTLRIAIGISNQVSQSDLLAFASPNDVIRLENYTQLFTAEDDVINAINAACGRPPLPTATTAIIGLLPIIEQATTTIGPQPIVIQGPTSTPLTTTANPIAVSTTTVKAGPVAPTTIAVATTTTTLATTTTTTTPAQLPPGAAQIAFSFGLNQNGPNPGSTIQLNTQVSSINSAYNYNLNSNQWPSVVASGLYFVEVCAAVMAGQTTEVLISGTTPVVGFSWESTTQNSVESNCRGALMQLTAKTSPPEYLFLASGSLYSDQFLETMFSAFSVSNTMTSSAASNALFAVGPATGTTYTTNGPIPLTAVVTPTGGASFNGATATYTCGVTAPHFVSASVGVMSFTQTRVVVTNGIVPVELTRNSVTFNGVTTLSRTTLLSCNQGQTITMSMITGAVTSASNPSFNYDLTSLTIFPYQPNSVPPVAWQLYKSYISDSLGQGLLDPFYFDNVTLNIGNAYNPNSRAVNPPVSGYYYIYLSVGAGVHESFVMTLSVNNRQIFDINSSSTASDGEDTFGHGVVVHLNQGDNVRAVGQPNSYFFSGVAGYQTSFMGMLLYTP